MFNTLQGIKKHKKNSTGFGDLSLSDVLEILRKIVKGKIIDDSPKPKSKPFEELKSKFPL